MEDLAYGGSDAVLLRGVAEIGDDGGCRVAFDMPVRMSLEGQAGGRALYIDGGPSVRIVPIGAACAVDNAARVDRHLNGTGECRIDSEDGDMAVYTYHLTWFGAAESRSGAPPPVYHTCSAGLGSPSQDIGDAVIGGRSNPAEQTLINYGSAPFAQVGVEASPWRAASSGGASPGAASPILPAPANGTD